MNIDPVDREKKALELLDAWPWKLGGVLIGGYAIAAYGRPRYSDDIDIVIPLAAQKRVQLFVVSQGLSLENSSTPNPQNYEGMVFRYKAEELKLDILVSCVRDREAQVDIPEQWISRSRTENVLTTLTGKTAHRIPIARAEALWALKLQSGRAQDITDLFSISNIKIDSNEIISLFRELKSKSLTDKLSKTLEKTRTKKIFEDSMLRLESKRTDKNKRDWTSFADRVQYIVYETLAV